MKRKGNIYEEICKRENIEKAIQKASCRKRNRPNVKRINENVDYYVLELQKMLINREYKPSPYIEKTIHDGANKKERVIYKPCFYPDQCIHWCLMLQIRDLLKRRHV